MLIFVKNLINVDKISNIKVLHKVIETQSNYKSAI